MKRLDPSHLDHQAWLGFVQPVGLVVSPAALVRQGVTLPRSDRESQELLREAVQYDAASGLSAEEPFQPISFAPFAQAVLGWRWIPQGYDGMKEHPIPEELQLTLPDYEVTLEPSYAVKELNPAEGQTPWQLLVCNHPVERDFDTPYKDKGTLEASPQNRIERLLRGTGVPAGILYNGRSLRIVSAPHGESSGWIDFRVADMVQDAGRSICSAMRLLISEQRLLAMSAEKRFANLLVQSRKYQNDVSETLAEQVLHALYELMRGLQSAHDRSDQTLLKKVLAEDPDEVYRALLHTILRMVFLLYAEEREMLPTDETFQQSYSLAGLYDRLRGEEAQYPDTMNERYGAYAQLLVLFRLIHDGAEALKIPARHGVLFDPEKYPFLEGRNGDESDLSSLAIPLLPDGAIYRALEKLLVLDGERISYRALDVEQIGSVYETMMGFRIEKATGTSLAIKAQKKGGAPTTIDLDALLEVPAAKRGKWIQDRTDRKMTPTQMKPVKVAENIDDLHAALDKVIDRAATPDRVPAGSLVLQPSEARRKSGSHYTPRELTEPIVRTTLKPILDRLRQKNEGPPTPEQILDLKVCDPAMGSAAFLVETARQLGEALIEAWNTHDAKPEIPGDEDEVVHARRLVAQRCLYGVDRNPVAVDLAKVSLWLATLAKEHPFTFVDHALRHGDSLVGLTNTQIAARDWSSEEPLNSPRYRALKEKIDQVVKLRRKIREAVEETSEAQLRNWLAESEKSAEEVRTWGDLVIEAFFSEEKDKARKEALTKTQEHIATRIDPQDRQRLDRKRNEDPPLAPFHWELEFPEVFDRSNPGIDAFVGNPPFLGGSKISGVGGKPYLDWILQIHPESHGNGDLVAHFFRRAFNLLGEDGTFGLIATNRIAQGDTRTTGLEWICENGGHIYDARRRLKWPGSAAVVVSIVHVYNGQWAATRKLDGIEVPIVTAFLFRRGGHKSPSKLSANRNMSFMGSKIYGNGFTFDDTDRKGVASSIAEMEQLIASNSKNGEVIFPYIGGAEVNDSPTHAHHRYVINFGERDEEECRRIWPSLMEIVEEKVKPERVKLTKNSIGRKRAQYWWQYGSTAKQLYNAIAELERVLVISASASKHYTLTFSSSDRIHSQKLNVFALQSMSCFTTLQCRVHEEWSRAMGTTRGVADDLTYNSGRVFETFPFPDDWQIHPALEAAGQAYYDFRADLMVETDLGMTKTYNRFHDPEEDDPQIVRLRELHSEMDRAVLAAYGWDDIPTECEFLLDYDDDEDEGSKKKKPWRYRWPNDVQEEVLARLLELNAQRAAEERQGVSDSDQQQGDLYSRSVDS